MSFKTVEEKHSISNIWIHLGDVAKNADLNIMDTENLQKEISQTHILRICAIKFDICWPGICTAFTEHWYSAYVGNMQNEIVRMLRKCK